MENKILKIIEDEKRKTEQSIFKNEIFNPVNINPSKNITNTTIAKMIYEFLNNVTDELPNYEYLQEIIDNSKSYIISIYNGIILSLDKIREKEELIIELEKILTNNSILTNIITKDKFISYTKKEEVEEIKYSHDVIYDKTKLAYLQNYIRNYYNKIHETNKITKQNRR